MKTLVPGVIGQTTEAQMRKSVNNRKIISDNEFLESLDEPNKFLYRFNKFSDKNSLKINWGQVSFSMNINLDGELVSIFEGYSPVSRYDNSIHIKYYSILSKVEDGKSVIELYSSLKTFTKEGKNGLI